MIPVKSRDNTKIKILRKLRSRKFREQSGLCYVEGIRQVYSAFEEGFHFEFLIVSSDLLRSEHAWKLVNDLISNGAQVIDVDQNIFKSISLRDNPQGIAGVVRQKWHSLESIDPREGLCLLALKAVQDPGNIGSILRTADAVGVRYVILLGDSVDPYDPNSVRAGAGATFTVKLIKTSFERLLDWKNVHQIPVIGAVGGAPLNYSRVNYPYPCILLMGSERQGLDLREQSSCDMLVSIPMVGKVDSLNLAVATSVILYEIFDQRSRL